mmetsp:Transcript_27008/g.49139  ORF Transcript_27008/g.49139 Transcript_27008/m.49139 type:complete len:96 (+) Transcript_27008:1032-1319(+)
MNFSSNNKSSSLSSSSFSSSSSSWATTATIVVADFATLLGSVLSYLPMNGIGYIIDITFDQEGFPRLGNLNIGSISSTIGHTLTVTYPRLVANQG